MLVALSIGAEHVCWLQKGGEWGHEPWSMLAGLSRSVRSDERMCLLFLCRTGRAFPGRLRDRHRQVGEGDIRGYLDVDQQGFGQLFYPEPILVGHRGVHLTRLLTPFWPVAKRHALSCGVSAASRTESVSLSRTGASESRCWLESMG